MAYQVLARKWRPTTFDDLVGQEHVVKALRHALDTERLHHAYLFTGTRGVGKTTVARILAKALNCERGVSSTPCDECSCCVEINEGRSVDLIEVDAASRTKVEDTRELLDNVLYAPTRSRYKVYLIDEVHMLSGHSFNALLKTLEEPPEHVKFLLATTDPQKLPATVLSRCLQFSLKSMSAQRVVEHLQRVLDAEGVSYDDSALWHIGRSADGSMRDALSLTDQAIAYGAGSLREQSVNELLGTVDRKHVHAILRALNNDAPRELLSIGAHMNELGIDFVGAVDELCSLLHRCAIAQVVPQAIDQEQSDASDVSELAQQLTAEDVQLFYDLAQRERDVVLRAADAHAAFDMLLLRMHTFRPIAALDPELKISDVAEIEAPLSPTATQLATSSEDSARSADTNSVVEAPAAKKSEPPPAASGQGGIEEPSHAPWHELVDSLALTGSAASIASHCVVTYVEKSHWCLALDCDHANLFNDRHALQIGAALQEHLAEPVNVSIEIKTVAEETPASRRVRIQKERLQAAERAIQADPRVSQLLEDFEGVVVDGSITVDATRKL
ncbi:MAG: DNA polymerase III subunit gamma/tau [Pseudomonadota bacterium]